MSLKTCSCCKEIKQTIDFYRNSAMKDGLTNQCKICSKLSGKKAKLKIKNSKIIPEIKDLPEEIWKQVEINGVIFDYQISNLGRLKSFKLWYPTLITPSEGIKIKGRNGYLAVSLRTSDRKKYHSIRIHRLVALAFLPNPDDLPQINHINGDKSDNRVENLEWCSALTNIRHSFETGLNVGRKGKDNPLYGRGRKVSLNGIIYNSVAECARQNGLYRTSLQSELDGRMKTIKGIKYVD
jgi:hypothetical protein